MSYPQHGVTGIVGFAQVANVTGGQGGEVVFVNNVTQLKKAISGIDKRIVIINQSIGVPVLTKLSVGSNKSIIGAFGGNNILKNIHFRSGRACSNVIFQNLVFQHSQGINDNDDIQLYLTKGRGFWIDHCTWLGHTWSADDGSLDKLIYIGKTADYATISHCYFKDHKYGCIFGFPSEDNPEYEGYPHLTLCHNYYSNIEVRSPGLMRYGYYHVYNNLIDHYSLSFTLISSAKVISENNYFQNGKSNGGLDDKGEGATFSDSGSVPAITATVSGPSQWTANSNYNYNLMTAEQAREWNLSHSGAQDYNEQFIFSA